MLDIALLVGRLLFVALLYLFLFAIMKTGIGLVKGQRKKDQVWSLVIQKGPKELRGVKMSVYGPIIVGRSPGCDIVVGAGFVSGRHARFTLMGENLFIEDLGSTNGTAVNGNTIDAPYSLKPSDTVTVGDVEIKALRG